MEAGLAVGDHSGSLTVASGELSETVALSGSVTALPVAATPTFSPAGGTYSEAQTVTITCETEGATIHYTLNGDDPDENSPAYIEALTIATTTTVKAIAVKNGYDNSEIASATYSIVEPQQEKAFTLITSTDALATGEKYIVVGLNDNVYKALGKQNSNNRAAVEVAPSGSTIITTPATLPSEDAIFELTLGQDSTGYWTLFDAANQGYLYAASSSSNYLRTQATNDANGQWTISIANDGVATVIAQGANTRNTLRYNSGSSLFSCYDANNSQKDVYIYKAGDMPQPEPELAVAPATLSGFTYTFGSGPSTTQTLSVSGSNLEANVVLTATQGFEVALSADGTFAANLTLTPSNGTLAATDIHVRMAAGLEVDDYTGSLTVTSGELSQTVALSGSVTALPVVATPTFSPEGGTCFVAQSVTITCETDGATIHYTLNGNDPDESSPVYSEALTITTTTTVKAIAVKEGFTNSAVASATYTFPSLITIAEARALANDEYALVQGVVTLIDGRNVYVQDATAGIDLYLNSNTVPSSLALGDLVKAYGKKTVYNGLVELSDIDGSNADKFSIVSSGNSLPLAVKTIAEILADHTTGADQFQATRVKVESATLGAINTNSNTTLTQGESTINIYKIPALTGIAEGDIVDVTAVIGCYNNAQLRVALATDVELVSQPTPTLTVAPASLSGFTYTFGSGPSTTQTLSVSGSNLTANVTVTAPEGFEVALSADGTFAANLTLSPNDGNLAATDVYVRMDAELSVGDHYGSLTVASGELSETVALSGTVTVMPIVATPTFDPTEGTYTEAQTVTIACATEGATIHYTTDGSEPTLNSLVYSSPLTIAETTTVKAFAVKDGFTPSETAEATYTIQSSVAVFNQDWEGEMHGWTFVDVEGEMSWTVAQYQGNHYAYANGYNHGANIDWCISPAFDLGDYINPVLNFRTAMKFTGNDLEVYFSNNYNGTDPTTATWTQLSCALSQGNYNWVESGDIDLSGFNGSNCYIGFKYTCTESAAAAWEVDDITLSSQTTIPSITATPIALSGFSYIVGNGPSAEQSFTVSGLNLTANLTIEGRTDFEISLTQGANFNAQSTITLTPSNGTVEQTTIYVRMKAGLTIGEYEDDILIASTGADEVEVTCIGSVLELPEPGGDYVHITDVNALSDGIKVILAARYSQNANAYLAIGNTLDSGKLNTTECTINGEALPSSIVDNEDSYYWTVAITDGGYTFTNANGQMIGYGASGTNFVMGGEKTEWTINSGVSPETSLVPNYQGFNIVNTTNDSRAFAGTCPQ